MKIRAATGEDFDTLISMGEKFYADTAYADFAPYTVDSAAGLFDMMIRDGVMLVAEHKPGEIIGMVGLVVIPFMFNAAKKMAHEVMWWVAPEWRGTSAGPMLMAAVEPACKESGAEAIMMLHLPNSPGGVGRLYERMGFRLSETTYTKVI